MIRGERYPVDARRGPLVRRPASPATRPRPRGARRTSRPSSRMRGRVDDQRHQVRIARRRLLKARKCRLDCGRVALARASPAPARSAPARGRGRCGGWSTGGSSSTSYRLTPTITRCSRLHLRLVAERRLGDLALREVLLDRGDHAAELVESGRSTRTRLPRAGWSAPRRNTSPRADRSCSRHPSRAR